jgi:PAS domain S-box-containing protein
MFVLYGAAVFLRTRLPKNRAAYWTSLAITAIGALVAAFLLISSLQGLQFDVEHLGFSITNRPGETPVGHMSPVTAFCFLLSSLSYLLSLSPAQDSSWRASTAWLVACLIIAISLLLILAYLYGTPFLYGSSFIPPAALTSMAFAALGISLLAHAAPHAWPARGQAEFAARTSYTFVLVFVLLAAGIVIAGFLYYRNYERRYRTEVEHEISAIAGLKADGLVQWRKERMGDAAVLYKNANFSERVRRHLEKPEDAEAQERLRTWLQHVWEGYPYDRVFLLDARGRERMSMPETRRSVSRQVTLQAAEVLRTKQVAFVDFYRNEFDQRVYLAILVPIFEERGAGRAWGTLVLCIDPGQYLYPFMKRWPTPSRTAETLIVRREGNDVLFLSELRFQKDTALNLRLPLVQEDFPAVQAALGREGLVEGRDYRGVPVIADVRPVPDSPWFLVARMDIAEVHEPMREKLWMMAALVGALLMGAGGGVGLVWRRQRTQFYREKYVVAEALRESEERFRLLVEGVKDYAIIMLDPAGNVMSWNQGAERIKGYGSEEIIGRHFSRFYPEEDVQQGKPQRELEQAAADGRFEDEGWRVRKDGTRFWANAILTALRDGDGGLRGFSKVTRDITERKQAEEKIKRMNEELEQRVKDRTAELEVANRELEGFSYSVSHDLRAPLRHLTGFVELLSKRATTLDEKSRHYLAVIGAAASQMGRLVDDLLSFSRMGRSEMMRARVDLRALLDEAIRDLLSDTKERNIHWDIKDLPTVSGDAAMLKLVFVNLLSNAVKFTRLREQALIEISGEQTDGEVIVSVRDNGVGFDMKYKDKLFNLFQRLHRTEEFEGTGVGLASVRRIIHRHGGKTWAEGEPGRGATVFFSLPEIKGG